MHNSKNYIIDLQRVKNIFGKLYNMLKTKNKNNWLLHKFNINLCMLVKRETLITNNKITNQSEKANLHL